MVSVGADWLSGTCLKSSVLCAGGLAESNGSDSLSSAPAVAENPDALICSAASDLDSVHLAVYGTSILEVR